MGVDLPRHFEHVTEFDPTAGVDVLLPTVPAKWCVYCLADDEDRPVQLLCVKNLRASLQRRLGEQGEEPTKRANLSAIVRNVYYSRVDSAFEQDFIYLEAARELFPESYGGVLGFYPAWFIHVNPQTTYPRFTKQNQIDKAVGQYFGPVADKHAANKLVRQIEEVFDLCRDWEHLTHAGDGPCQWRQMGKCVGPCEGPPGGISLEGYGAVIRHAADVLADVDRAVENHQIRMKRAATAMAYEAAGQIKQFVDTLDNFRNGNNRHLRPIERFRFLAIMPGGRVGACKLFVITPGRITTLAALLDLPTKVTAEPILRTALSLAEADFERPMSDEGFERISLVTNHLFSPKRIVGEFIPIQDVDEKRFLSACRAVAKPPKEPDADEGEVRGLQSL